MRFAFCVAVLAVCLVALQCTASNDTSENQTGDQTTENLGAAAETETNTKKSEPVTLPEVSEAKTDSTFPQVPETPPAPVIAVNHLTTRTRDDQTTLQPPSEKLSGDLKDQQQFQSQQSNTDKTSGENQGDNHSKIKPQGDNLHSEGETQSQSDVKPPDAPTSPQNLPQLPSSEQSKQQQSQQSQEPLSNTNPSGEKSQEENGNASQPGQNVPPTTTTEAETEKTNDSGKEITTTTVASTQEKSTLPNTTLQKESKLPQSVNNKDSSSSISFLCAFVSLVTLAVIPVVRAF